MRISLNSWGETLTANVMEDALIESFSYSSCNNLCYEEEQTGILYMLNLGCLAAVQLPRQLIYLTFSTNLATYSEWVYAL